MTFWREVWGWNAKRASLPLQVGKAQDQHLPGFDRACCVQTPGMVAVDNTGRLFERAFSNCCT